MRIRRSVGQSQATAGSVMRRRAGYAWSTSRPRAPPRPRPAAGLHRHHSASSALRDSLGQRCGGHGSGSMLWTPCSRAPPFGRAVPDIADRPRGFVLMRSSATIPLAHQVGRVAGLAQLRNGPMSSSRREALGQRVAVLGRGGVSRRVARSSPQDALLAVRSNRRELRRARELLHVSFCSWLAAVPLCAGVERQYSSAGVTVVSATVANPAGGEYVRRMATQTFRNPRNPDRNSNAVNNCARDAGCSQA